MNEHGSTIILAVVFGAVFALMAAGTMTLAMNGVESGKKDEEVMKAYWTNESAMNVGSELVLQSAVTSAGVVSLLVNGIAFAQNGRGVSLNFLTLGSDTAHIRVGSGLPGGDTAWALAEWKFNVTTTPKQFDGKRWSTVIQ